MNFSLFLRRSYHMGSEDMECNARVIWIIIMMLFMELDSLWSLLRVLFGPLSSFCSFIVTTSWHTEDDAYRAPPIDRSILPTAPRAAREPNIDRSRLPRSPPYTAFLGNLPYDVTEESIKNFFRGLNVSFLCSCESAEGMLL